MVIIVTQYRIKKPVQKPLKNGLDGASVLTGLLRLKILNKLN